MHITHSLTIGCYALASWVCSLCLEMTTSLQHAKPLTFPPPPSLTALHTALTLARLDFNATTSPDSGRKVFLGKIVSALHALQVQRVRRQHLEEAAIHIRSPRLNEHSLHFTPGLLFNFTRRCHCTA